MDTTVVKSFLDTCHKAKRIAELMPELPCGMTPRHVHVRRQVKLKGPAPVEFRDQALRGDRVAVVI